MSRLDTAALAAKLVEREGATPDESGAADYVSDRGSIVIAGDSSELKSAFKRLKKVDGYRWIVINREDLFAANPLSLGSKAGILDADGNVLKAADIPRKRV